LDILNKFEITENSNRFWELILKVFGGVTFLVTLIWSLVQFNLTKQLEIDSFTRTKHKEIAFAYWNRKMEVYSSLMGFAGLLSVTPPPFQQDPAYKGFWQTYFGTFQAYSLGDKIARDAADRFTKAVLKAEKIIAQDPTNTNINRLQDAALQDEAKALSDVIGKSINEDLDRALDKKRVQ
jgi:hypothetical protein